jgi:intraflagellar transport protein 81
VIQELRQLREAHGEMESQYTEASQAYSASLAGIQSEAVALEREVSGYQRDITSDQSKYAQLNALMNLLDIEQDRILQEMKAYVGGGGDESLELIQQQRGFKTYRDLFTKKIQEAEAMTRNLKEQQKVVKSSQDTRLGQLKEFDNLYKLLEKKSQVNRDLLLKAMTADQQLQAQLTGRGGRTSHSPVQQQDRLVL